MVTIPAAAAAALDAARSETGRPSLIACKTHIGYGSPNRQDTAKAHGEPLGEAEIALTKERLGLPVDETFYVADGVRAFLAASGSAGAKQQRAWATQLAEYARTHADEAAVFQQMLHDELPPNWDEIYPDFEGGKSLATRASSGQVLNAIAPHVPQLLGGIGRLDRIEQN